MYTVIAAIVIFSLSMTCFQYYAEPKVLRSDLSFLARAFKNIHLMLLNEALIIFLMTVALVPAVKNQKQFPLLSKLTILTTFIIVVVEPPVFKLYMEFHAITGVAVVFEQIRLLMKFISFVVECSRENSTCDPSFTSFLYFLFAPTVIYRDSYPRSRSRRYDRIARYLCELFAILWIALIILNHGFLKAFNKVGRKDLTASDYYHMLQQSFILGNYTTLIGFGYAFFHCWLNLWSEILLFADRNFYKNWLQATNVFYFLRIWSFLVHVWLKDYIYKPVMWKTGSTFLATICSFGLSFIVHDYIVCINMEGYFFVCCFFLIQGVIAAPVFMLIKPYLPTPKSEGKKAIVQEKVKETMAPLNIGFTIFYMFMNVGFAFPIAVRYYQVHNCPDAPFQIMDAFSPLFASRNCMK